MNRQADAVEPENSHEGFFGGFSAWIAMLEKIIGVFWLYIID